jgi:hypothetical protein
MLKPRGQSLRQLVWDSLRFALGAGMLVYQTVNGRTDTVLTLAGLALVGYIGIDRLRMFLGQGVGGNGSDTSVSGSQQVSSLPTPSISLEEAVGNEQ